MLNAAELLSKMRTEVCLGGFWSLEKPFQCSLKSELEVIKTGIDSSLKFFCERNLAVARAASENFAFKVNLHADEKNLVEEKLIIQVRRG